ncbi:sensor histidine kinase, partial [Millisia brevis]|uniref:sensor histidine kinase n=1 Tax=Millisia brevis TaxID=264148 RepID=UPI00083367A0
MVIVPIILAIVLGVLRVQESYQRASELAQSGDAVTVLAPAAQLDAVKDALLVSGGTDPQVLDAFNATVEQLGASMADADVAEPVRVGVENALTAAIGLRDRLAVGNVPPTDLNRSGLDIFSGLRAAILDSAADDIDAIRVAKVALVAAAEGRQFIATQQLLVGPAGGESAVDLTGATAAAGQEQGAIATLIAAGVLSPEEATRLSAGVDSRLAAYREADLTSEPVAAAAIDSFADSRVIYNDKVQTYITALGAALDEHSNDARTVFIRDLVLITLAVLAALIFAAFVARSLVRSLRVLREGALAVARDDLPNEILQIRSGGDAPAIRPIPIESREEVGQVARAVDAIHEEALMLAGEQTRLRLQIGSMFETLSRRSRSLVDQQLALIDRLERDEDDPSRLDSLFRLDHLAARMRRNGANLLVLAGTQTRRSSMEPVSLDAIIGSAVSEVEDYQRVLVKDFPQVAVAGSAVDDLVHLLAELLDNALRYSPPNTAVTIGARRTGEGVDLEIIDHGLGIPAAELDLANERLASGGDVTAETARRMGLFVVGRLAGIHSLTVRLRRTSAAQDQSGITAEVRVPVMLLAQTDRSDFGQPGPQQSVFDDRQTVFGASDATGRVPAINGGADPAGAAINGVAPQDNGPAGSVLPSINGRRPGDGPAAPPLPTRQPARNRADG